MRLFVFFAAGAALGLNQPAIGVDDVTEDTLPETPLDAAVGEPASDPLKLVEDGEDAFGADITRQLSEDIQREVLNNKAAYVTHEDETVVEPPKPTPAPKKQAQRQPEPAEVETTAEQRAEAFEAAEDAREFAPPALERAPPAQVSAPRVESNLSRELKAMAKRMDRTNRLARRMTLATTRRAQARGDDPTEADTPAADGVNWAIETANLNKAMDDTETDEVPGLHPEEREMLKSLNADQSIPADDMAEAAAVAPDPPAPVTSPTPDPLDKQLSDAMDAEAKEMGQVESHHKRRHGKHHKKKHPAMLRLRMVAGKHHKKQHPSMLRLRMVTGGVDSMQVADLLPDDQ
mmetsp:Transcript_36258/g.79157  ORF Transcript_36258/g.79157 Transcript_36258/m.79157 type:complete len:347 (+) Transcript_36258:94-1134(+)|eukprot:CAMPEP_0204276420 /NCGR_PEP_ID=MMETSP0468-20130131/28089_1 /ASSEMBLY_ACC=CAM_ASM_000383 /TAXON_ID=2969 /ORGANISM="Oxyrrhis marina" /LENGTH=346 /DNA_ID=CAMNT_0051253015 /DNA_START=76 /DNA_END=1116 /DNA_ORIENTATION=+